MFWLTLTLRFWLTLPLLTDVRALYRTSLFPPPLPRCASIVIDPRNSVAMATAT